MNLLKAKRIVVCVFLIVAVFFPGTGLAETDIEKRLRVLEERYENRSKRMGWLDRFSFKGDFRLRHEGFFRDPQNASDTTDRQRQRIRLRLGGAFHLYKDLDVGFRLATGGTDPLSTNQTLDNTAETKGIQLDRAYADYRIGPFELTGGKFAVPFMKSELMWDGDLNLEGAAEQFVHKMGDTRLKLIFGQFVIDEISGLNDDPYLLAYQAIVDRALGFGKIKVGLGYFQYNNLAGNTIDHNPGVSASTNTLSGTDHAFNISTLDLIGELTFDTSIPVTLFAEYATNTEDDATLDDAWQIGFKLNRKAKRAWDWQVRYLYRLVQKDAVFANWSDSDLHGGGTNGRGHETGIDVVLRKGVLFQFTYFISQEERGPKDDLDRLQTDLVFKF